jgi:diguanylate cyclase (GGDEF)-like protein
MLDIRTLVVMLVVCSLLMAITLTVGIKTGRRPGFVIWNAGLCFLAVGWVLVACRGLLPDWVTIALADGFMITGLCMELAAIIEFGGRPVHRALLFVPGLLMFPLLVPLTPSYANTALLMSPALAVLFFAIAAAALRLGPKGGPGRWIIAVVCFFSMIMVSLRALVIWLNPEIYSSVFVSSRIQELTFIALTASTIVVPLGFLLMNRERDEAELHKLATVDSLTGLFNRRAFIDLAGREIARVRRLKSPYAVLMIDLDLFKHVNDDFGHQAGDRVLADFARATMHSVRTEDLVGRYGGEEFCVLLPGATMQPAIVIAERLRSAVSQRPLGHLPRVTTVSIGVAACGAASGVSLDAAIHHADEALYRAKREGRDRVVGVEVEPPNESAAVQ